MLLALIKAKLPFPLPTTGNTARVNLFKINLRVKIKPGGGKRDIAFTVKHSENWFQLSLLPTSRNVNIIVRVTKFVHLWKQLKKSDIQGITGRKGQTSGGCSLC